MSSGAGATLMQAMWGSRAGGWPYQQAVHWGRIPATGVERERKISAIIGRNASHWC